MNGREKKIGRRKVKNAKKNGALLCVLDLFSPDFFLARLDFSPPQLTAPGSPRMRQENKPKLSVYIFSQCQCFVSFYQLITFPIFLDRRLYRGIL